MAVTMNIARAKAKLSELVARAERGEEVILTRAGKPAVKLTVVVPPEPEAAPVEKPGARLLGALAHLGGELSDPYMFHGTAPAAKEKPFKKVWGAWAHLGPPPPDDLFLQPDPDVEEMLRKWETESFSRLRFCSTPTSFSGRSTLRPA